MGEEVHHLEDFHWVPLCSKPWESRCEYSSHLGPLLFLGRGGSHTAGSAGHGGGRGPSVQSDMVYVVHGFLYSD